MSKVGGFGAFIGYSERVSLVSEVGGYGSDGNGGDAGSAYGGFSVGFFISIC